MASIDDDDEVVEGEEDEEDELTTLLLIRLIGDFLNSEDRSFLIESIAMFLRCCCC